MFIVKSQLKSLNSVGVTCFGGSSDGFISSHFTSSEFKWQKKILSYKHCTP